MPPSGAGVLPGEATALGSTGRTAGTRVRGTGTGAEAGARGALIPPAYRPQPGLAARPPPPAASRINATKRQPRSHRRQPPAPQKNGLWRGPLPSPALTAPVKPHRWCDGWQAGWENSAAGRSEGRGRKWRVPNAALEAGTQLHPSNTTQLHSRSK